MKKLEFETSKGRFVVTDVPDILNGDVYYGGSKNKGIKISEITEEQAREIVDEELDSHLKPCYKSYTLTEIEHVEWEDEFIHYSAIESLHSLLKSKGIHLFENPIKLPHNLEYCSSRRTYYGYEVNEYRKAEEKTFYNPYIFKI